MTVENSPNYKKIFNPHNETAGWIQGPISTRPVTGVVIGRELRDVFAPSDGEIMAVIESYYANTGNGEPLTSLPDAQWHDGWSPMKEIVVKSFLSLESAMKLDYSPTSIPLEEGATYIVEAGIFESPTCRSGRT